MGIGCGVILTMATAAILAAGGLYCFAKGKKKNESDVILGKSLEDVEIKTKVVEGTVKFSEVINWFRGLQLTPESHIPFVAKYQAYKDMIPVKHIPEKKVVLFLGVYDKKSDAIVYNLLLEADELDDKLREILGNESMVVLK